MEKQQLRKEMKLLRKELPESVRKTEEMQVHKILSDSELMNEHVFYCYVSYRTEFPTFSLITWLLEQHKRVLVPRIDSVSPSECEMNFYEITSKDQLFKGYQGIPEPLGATVSVLCDGVMLLPGLAFTNTGKRLGYGGGFYDRFLEKAKQNSVSIKTYGLCFSSQILTDVPTDKNDQILDGLLCCSGLLTTR